MRLALKDGCSISEVTERYTGLEVMLWQAYERLYGPYLLHDRLDILFARSDLLFMEANRNRKKRSRPYKLKDALVSWGSGRKKKKPVTAHTEESLFRKVVQAFGIEDDVGRKL